MGTVEAGARVTPKNILYLTDFSGPSEAALPFARAIAHEYGAKVYALHVLTLVPMAYATPEWRRAWLRERKNRRRPTFSSLNQNWLACHTKASWSVESRFGHRLNAHSRTTALI